MENKKLTIVQIMRLAAASVVVFFHAPGYISRIFPDDYANHVLFTYEPVSGWGQSGVDMFFIISGFIMVWVSFEKFGIATSSISFIKRRLIRIIPPYWAYTTLALILLAFAPKLFSHGQYLDWPWIICSYLFIPWYSPMGSIFSPLIGLGWTLNYEMYFYILFAIILCFRINPAIISITIFFLICPLIGSLHSFTFPLLIQNTSWILLEFIFGMWIGYFFSRGRWLSKSISIAFLITGCLALIFTTIYCPPMLNSGFGLHSARLVLWGIPYALLFAAIVSLFRHLPDNWLFKSLEKGGDASYSIYLFQVFALPGFAYIIKIIGLNRFIQIDILTFSIAIGSILSSYIAYLLVEKPLTTFLRHRIKI